MYIAYLHGYEYGRGSTAEEATNNAVSSYESAVGYGQQHEFADRQAFIGALDVEQHEQE